MNLLFEPLLEYLALPTIEIKQPSARLLETVDRCLDLALEGNQNWEFDLNRVLCIIQKSNVSEFHAEYTNHSGELGIVVFFKKGK